jgi:CheY-like chemotaxis protein
MSLARKDGKYAPLPHFTHTRSNGSNTCQTRANLMFIPIVYPQLSVPPRLAIGNEVIAVLSVSPIQQDHDTLASFLGRDQWRIHNALSLRSASAFLRAHAVPLVVCEHDLSPGSWTQLLDETRLLAIPPVLIMMCRVADDSLWAEALNLGAYDVLAKPFDRAEVTRILSSAWQHWQRQYCFPTILRKVMPTSTAAAA